SIERPCARPSRADLDESLFDELAQEPADIGLESERVDIVRVEHRVAYLRERHRFAKQIPNPRSDRVEAVVHTVLQVHDRGLAGEITRHLILRDDEARRVRKMAL